MKREVIDTRHAGQIWYTQHHVSEDLSVIANPFGLPSGSAQFLADNLSQIGHYPASDWEPARSRLFEFLRLPEQPEASSARLLLGNGASELIDVLLRYLGASGARSYITGPSSVQYKEYEKTALLCGMNASSSRRNADVHLLVNPNNPTGSFLRYPDLKSYIQQFAKAGSAIIVDESILPWLGPDWTRESLLADVSWIHRLDRDRAIRVFVIHSWTKLWACCGLRIGSLLCPSDQTASCLREQLPPWNVNVLALLFLQAAVSDGEYLTRTWTETRRWRARLGAALQRADANWSLHGEDWLPWIWLDVVQPETAARFVEASIECGLPVRAGAIGYQQPSFVRVRVCSSEHQDILLQALSNRGVIA